MSNLTYIDILGENETINKPIKRLVNMGYNRVEMTRMLGAEDILVAYGANRTAHKMFLPKFAELPFVAGDESAKAENADFENIIGLAQKALFRKILPGVSLISLNMREPDVLVKTVRTYGYLIYRVAEEFIDWYSRYYDLFTSPQAIHQEYIDRFCHIDFDVMKNGTFVYPGYERWPVKD